MQERDDDYEAESMERLPRRAPRERARRGSYIRDREEESKRYDLREKVLQKPIQEKIKAQLNDGFNWVSDILIISGVSIRFFFRCFGARFTHDFLRSFVN